LFFSIKSGDGFGWEVIVCKQISPRSISPQTACPGRHLGYFGKRRNRGSPGCVNGNAATRAYQRYARPSDANSLLAFRFVVAQEKAISDQQQSWWYEDGPWKGPGPSLLVTADFY
jgi:hypothetical protein